MKEVFCIVCGKYEKIKNPKKSYIFDKVLSIVCRKCGNEDKKYRWDIKRDIRSCWFNYNYRKSIKEIRNYFKVKYNLRKQKLRIYWKDWKI